MKTKLILLMALALLTSCQLVDSYKGKEAIKLVQSKKFGAMNAYAMTMKYFLKYHDMANFELSWNTPNPTNLVMANIVADEFKNDNFTWQAKHIKDGTFLVSFYNQNKGDGFIWEADVENKIVRCVTCSTELLRKYNLATDTAASIKPKRKHHNRLY
jgi:hypothetical protein